MRTIITRLVRTCSFEHGQPATRRPTMSMTLAAPAWMNAKFMCLAQPQLLLWPCLNLLPLTIFLPPQSHLHRHALPTRSTTMRRPKRVPDGIGLTPSRGGIEVRALDTANCPVHVAVAASVFSANSAATSSRNTARSSGASGAGGDHDRGELVGAELRHTDPAP
jgi:hypothetical protein